LKFGIYDALSLHSVTKPKFMVAELFGLILFHIIHLSVLNCDVTDSCNHIESLIWQRNVVIGTT